MRIRSLLPLICLSCLFVLGCSKDKDDSSSDKSKAELITQSTWKFSDVKVGGISVASYLDACQKDNTATFTTGGGGTLDEGPTKCDSGDPQSAPFNWTLQTNETQLVVSAPLFDIGGNTFMLVSLDASQLVISQDITVSGITQNAVFTFVH